MFKKIIHTEETIKNWKEFSWLIKEYLKDEPKEMAHSYHFERNGISYEVVWDETAKIIFLYGVLNGQRREIASLNTYHYALEKGLVFYLDLSEEGIRKINELMNEVQKELMDELRHRLEQEEAKKQAEKEWKEKEKQRQTNLLEKYL